MATHVGVGGTGLEPVTWYGVTTDDLAGIIDLPGDESNTTAVEAPA
jgi:hypothetical protein